MGMTTLEKMALIGKLADYSVNELVFEVEITDVRDRFGKTDYLIVPLKGDGRRWVSASSIRVHG